MTAGGEGTVSGGCGGDRLLVTGVFWGGVAGGDADTVGRGWSAGIDDGRTTWVRFDFFFPLGFKRLKCCPKRPCRS